jgi:uncharacterized tellurite resistance protein B-like protein
MSEMLLLLFVVICFFIGYFVLSKIMDFAKRQTHGPAKSPTPAATPARQTTDDAAGRTPPSMESLFHLFTMMGKLAMCDGDLQPQESRFVDSCLSDLGSLPPGTRAKLLGMLRQANATATDFRYHAEGFRRLNQDNPSELGRALERLRALAAADAPVSDAERALLDEAASAFGIAG